MKRGEIWRVTFEPRSGSEQRGVRPALIVSSDVYNTIPHWKSFNAVPISSSSNQARRGQTSILLPSGTGGLSLDSYALCHQITTVDRAKFSERLGLISDEQLLEVDLGILAALDMMHLTKRFQ